MAGPGGDGRDDDERGDPFERAVSGARRLGSDAVEPPLRRRRAPASDDAPPAPALRLELDGEQLRGAAAGVNDALVARLARGEIEPQARLDLHGLGAEVARERALAFLDAQHGLGRRCALLIHGRGAHSAGGHAVLRDALPGWLETAARRGALLACASAPPRLGGSGATLVLLRRPRRD